jgi:hypothetical protein
VLAPDFVLSSEGGVSPEASFEQWVAALPAIDTQALEVDVQAVRVYGDSAVVQARLRWVARMGARDLSGDYVCADVFTRSEGRWRARWRISTRLG